jgi:hypothetical protein
MAKSSPMSGERRIGGLPNAMSDYSFTAPVIPET